MRSAVAQGSQAAGTAAAAGAGYGTAGQNVASSFVPYEMQQLRDPTGYSQAQQNAMLVAGEQGAGGAQSSTVGQANLQAARTRNPGGYAMALDEASRNQGRTLSQNALNVQVANANLQQQKQAQAARALQGLYGTDVSASLEAMGLIPKDIGAEAEANKTGWSQMLFGDKGIIPGLRGG